MSKFIIIDGWREIIQRTISVAELDDNGDIINQELINADYKETMESGEIKRIEVDDFNIASRNIYFNDIQKFIRNSEK